ncbi:alpha/beta-hydrolase [Trichodelitschia bisporula]|uniref:Alpha/beta-hydrolase n=1 Tax=Trichodelitschia bisporula TaxID=703511 RepID=A0A6G1I507_9PEZI|nr:alpha/beta-hydrolase [Trichodelitschia bisporula]
MPPRQPTAADMPPKVTCTITVPPPSHPPTHPLLLLHGIGDSHLALHPLAQLLSLPETTTINLRAPTHMPLLPGYHWGDDLTFSADGTIDPDAGFELAVGYVEEVISALVEKCGYEERDVLIMGLGQGGMVALEVARYARELRGVVSFGGGLPSPPTAGATFAATHTTASTKTPPTPATAGKSPTPVLLLKGARGSAVSLEAVARTREAFTHVEVVEWPREGDGMARNREEMLPVMRFFAQRLRSVRGIPKGAVELGR